MAVMRFLIACCLLLSTALPAKADDICRQLRRVTSPDVELTIDADTPSVSHNSTLADLESMRSSYDAAALEKGNHAAGLYLAGFHVTWAMEYNSIQHPQTGAACVDLTRLVVTVKIADPKIYVAQEVQNGSCLYREVLAHEQRHARVDRKVLDDERYTLTQDIRRSVMGLDLVRAGSVTLAGELLKGQISNFMQPLMNNISLERARLQADVDSKAEYQRVSTICQDDVQALSKAQPN